MTALFDSGSSRLHFGWWDESRLVDPVSVPYPESPHSLLDMLSGLLSGHTYDKAAACSVSNRWREPFFETLDRAVSGTLYVARTAQEIGLSVRYDDPSAYGIDRALAALAAYGYFRDSCIVIDAGTAVTVDAVDNNGTVVGGYIFPGIRTLVHGLTSLTDLPGIAVESAVDGIGTSTKECMAYGVSMGVAGAVSRLVTYADGIVKAGDRVLITGGGAQALMKLLPFAAIHRRFLVLEGLGHALDTLPKYA